jgi:phage recombination protein Bet
MKKTFSYNPDAALMIGAGIIPDAPRGVVEGFFEFCNGNGLNPWNKDAYMLEYWNATKGGKDYAYISNYRELLKVAAKSGDYAGIDPVLYNERRNEAGQMVYNTMAEVIASGKPPVTAQVTVYKIIGGQRFAFSYQVACSEYVKVKKDGQPYGNWKTMLFTMLEKVVMSRAIRLTWPVETGGFHVEEEIQAITGDTDAASNDVDTTKVVAPAGAAKKAEMPFPPTDKEAAERAELIETLSEAINACENWDDLNLVYKNNAHWCKSDTEVMDMFKARTTAIAKADAARNAKNNQA